MAALSDKHAGVRRHAVRLAERLHGTVPQGGIGPTPEAAEAGCRADPDAQVRLQLAYMLGSWPVRGGAGSELGQLVLKHRDDPHLTAAALSSLGVLSGRRGMAANPAERSDPAGGRRPVGSWPCWPRATTAASYPSSSNGSPRRRAAVTPRGKWRPGAGAGRVGGGGQGAGEVRLRAHLAESRPDDRTARATAADAKAAEADRVAALAVLGRESAKRADDVALLGELLVPQNPVALQSAAAGRARPSCRAAGAGGPAGRLEGLHAGPAVAGARPGR